MVDMICHAEVKRFIRLGYTKSSMGLMVCREKSIEQADKFALANETDVTDFNRRVLFSRVRLPERIAKSRMCNRKLIAKSVIVVCH